MSIISRKKLSFHFVLLASMNLVGCKSSNDDVEEKHQCGDIVAEFNGVPVRYNSGGVDSCQEGRHLSSDGKYSYGMKWQCVEFVRRYYFDALNHRMPEKYGNAKDYFRDNIPHGGLNTERDLIQYQNQNTEKPRVNDLLVCPKMAGGYGHVSIIKQVEDNKLTVIQQNTSSPTDEYSLQNKDGVWTIGRECAGFLRKASQ